MARIFRTTDGRHVPEGHSDAAFLAYGDSDEPPAEVLAELDGKPSRKARPRPADKESPRAADKSGLTVKRGRGDDAG
jgi:hypothetical protein